MAFLSAAVREEYALLFRREMHLRGEDDAPPEAKSNVPTLTLPRQFGLSDWPAGLDIEYIDTMANQRRRIPPKPNSWELAKNSAVLASINTVALGCIEAPVVVKQESEEEGGQLRLQTKRRHRAYKILSKPNYTIGDDPDSPVFMSMEDMVWLREYCLHIDGNMYWMIRRLGDPIFGLVTALVPVMPYMMEPVTIKSDDGTSADFISYYAYAPSKEYVHKPLRVDVRNILHFRYGRDPEDVRKGLGLVKELYREVFRDNISTQFTNRLLRNGAVPGLVVTPSEGTIEADEALEAKARLQAAFSGDELGSIAVLARGASIEQYGFDPDKLNLASFHKHAEERVAAVLNVPAMVAQLGAGLEQAAQFTNFHEAREMFAENTLIPRWRSANAVFAQLMKEFTNDPALRMVHDEDQVRALQGDISNKFQRLQVGVGGGWVTANEARAQVGMPPINLKSQEVPLTQGQDNRFNTLVEAGLVTLNEARESVGLPPTGGGDVPISQIVSPPDELGTPVANQDTNPDTAPGAGAAGKGNTATTNAPAGASQATTPRKVIATPGRQGADIPTTKSAPVGLEHLFETTNPDALFRAWKELRAEGLSLVEVAFPKGA